MPVFAVVFSSPAHKAPNPEGRPRVIPISSAGTQLKNVLRTVLAHHPLKTWLFSIPMKLELAGRISEFKDSDQEVDTMATQRTFSGAPWEAKVGYCRAIRRGSIIAVTGTAPVAEDGSVFAPGDAYAQTKHCLTIIARALNDLGASPADVIRTRLFVTDISRWEEYGRAHGEVFAKHPPATTMVEVSSLIDKDMLIEIEADAVVEAD